MSRKQRLMSRLAGRFILTFQGPIAGTKVPDMDEVSTTTARASTPRYLPMPSPARWKPTCHVESVSRLLFAMTRLFLTEEEWTVAELGNHLPVDVPGISRHVTRLVDTGVLCRRRPRDDRRYVLWRLTEERGGLRSSCTARTVFTRKSLSRGPTRKRSRRPVHDQKGPVQPTHQRESSGGRSSVARLGGTWVSHSQSVLRTCREDLDSAPRQPHHRPDCGCLVSPWAFSWSGGAHGVDSPAHTQFDGKVSCAEQSIRIAPSCSPHATI